MAVIASACTGYFDETAGPRGAPPAGEPLRCEAGEIDPGPSPLSLLSRDQYANTVRDLVGEVPGLEGDLTGLLRPSALGLSQPDVSQVQLEIYQRAAERIAAHAVSSPERLAALVPCEAGGDERACAERFVRDFGARAYRAPMSDEADVTRHLALYDVGRATSHAHGIELLLRGMLQSSRFLYRVELGTDEQVGPNAVALSSHELAARLSYALWDTLPDPELRAAADAGELDSEEGLRRQVDRMLAHERGQTVVRRFLESWLHTGAVEQTVKDEALFPEWSDPALRIAMAAQARAFLDHVLREEGGTLDALLTSPTVLVNDDLAGFYGVSAGEAFEPTEVSSPASGILTLPALLASAATPRESSPIYRGKLVRELLLCQQLPAPPPNIPEAPEIEPGVSTRERLRQHEVDPACSGCHQLMDPIGFGFEHFDAIGRYRELDGDQPVDASGEVRGTADSNGPFDGVVELGERLASSEEVESCLVRQWFRFVAGRFEQPADACSIDEVRSELRAADRDLSSLPHAMIGSDAFRYRRPIVPGSAP